MKKKIFACMSALLWLAVASAASAQNASQAQIAKIGSLQLQMGADKNQIIQTLQSRFALQPGTNGTTYVLYRMGQNGRAQGAAVGSVEFKNAQLERVVTNLGTLQGDEASRAMRKLIAKFAALQGPDGTPVTVHTDINESLTATTSWVYFRLPEKIIQIAVYEPKIEGSPVTVEITEQVVRSR